MASRIVLHVCKVVWAMFGSDRSKSQQNLTTFDENSQIPFKQKHLKITLF